ncbi:MAG: GPI anchored serine-threonine rich family protein [Ignavibacteriae bacterium]|nr:GPI anchored serine-threonine rich family protein [Ignavibacteriota bacterium]
MKRSHLFILTLVLMSLLFGSDLWASDKVRIVLNAPPPGSLNMADLWSFTISNLTNQQQQVYLKGSATEEKDGLIATAQTVSITLKPNETKNMKVSDLPQTPDVNYVAKDPRYSESLIRQGKFPEGSYEICVRVIQTGSNEELSSDCFSQTVQAQGTIIPISPSEGVEIDPDNQLIFSWTSTIKDAEYTLYISDISKNPGQDPVKARDKFSFNAGKKMTYNLKLGDINGFDIENAEKIVWWVEARSGGIITLGPFIPIPIGIKKCKRLSVNLQPSGNNDCCYKLIITNSNSPLSPWSFRLKTTTAYISSANTIPSGWTQSPGSVPPAVNTVTWNKGGPIPNASIMLSDVCFQSGLPSFYVVYEWLNKKKKVVCRDSVKVQCKQKLDTCLEVGLQSIKCDTDSAGYFLYYYTLTYNNPTGVNQNYYLTASCGNINLASPSVLPPGSGYIGGILASTSSTGVCCIYIHKPSGYVCDTVCFKLPPCPPVQSDTCMDILSIDSIRCLKDSIGNYQYTFSLNINNSYTASQYYSLTSTCGSVINYTPTNLPPGNNWVSGILSTPNNGGPCCIYLRRPSGAICDSICFNLPPCGQGSDTCSCGGFKNIFASHDGVFDSLHCGDIINMYDPGMLNINYNYYCYPSNNVCPPSMSWVFYNSSMAMINSGSSSGSLSMNISTPGSYTLVLKPQCGGVVCDSCIIYINVNNISQSCGCMIPTFGQLTINNGSVNYIKCGHATSAVANVGDLITYNHSLTCIGDSCNEQNFWTVSGPSGFNASGTTLPLQFTPTVGGMYDLTIGVVCNGDTCKCITSIEVVDSTGPCGFQITGGPQAGDTLCAGDNVTITWTSTGTPGNVNLGFIDVNNWVVNQSIVGNIPNSGSYNWTIPANIPCDSIRRWQFYVENTARTCWNYGPTFYIKCCDSLDCSINAPDTVCLDSAGNLIMTSNIIANNFPGSGSYSWQLISDPFNPTSCPGRSGSFSNSPGSINIYNWGITPPCRYILRVSRGGCTAERYITVVDCNTNDSCKCGYWKKNKVRITNLLNNTRYRISCDSSITVDFKKPVILFPEYVCAGNCTATYTCTIIKPNGTSNTWNGRKFTATLGKTGLYTVTQRVYCGGILCDSCTIYINKE